MLAIINDAFNRLPERSSDHGLFLGFATLADSIVSDGSGLSDDLVDET